MKTFFQLREATDRTKRNPTRDFLRKYPVSDAEMVKPVKPAKKKEEKKSVAEGYTGRETKDGTWHVFKDGQAVAVSGPHKSREEAAAWIKKQKQGVAEGEVKTQKYEMMHRNGQVKKFVAKDDADAKRIAAGHGAKSVIKLRGGVPAGKVSEQGVAEAAFKDPSPMMKDTIKQDKIRSLNNLISIAKVKGVHHKVKEYESELKKLKETTEVTEAGAFSYGAKPPRKGSVAYNALMKRKEQDKKRVKEIEAIGTKNHHVGVARVVTKEDNEHVTEAKDTDQYSYIDQTKGPVIKGKSGTYVGYTHSATKGKGANILKHNKTKKYYAAGGSSTAFTQKTTLHDTPEAAAKAYHKGNLAEASPMIKPPKNEFGKKEDAFAHAKQHGGKVMKKTFTHPTSGIKTVSYVVKEDVNNEAYMGKVKPSKSPHQKFKDSMKRAGYDMDAGAKRLQDLLAKHKKERDERESVFKVD